MLATSNYRVRLSILFDWIWTLGILDTLGTFEHSRHFWALEDIFCRFWTFWKLLDTWTVLVTSEIFWTLLELKWFWTFWIHLDTLGQLWTFWTLGALLNTRYFGALMDSFGGVGRFWTFGNFLLRSKHLDSVIKQEVGSWGRVNIAKGLRIGGGLTEQKSTFLSSPRGPEGPARWER